MAENDIQYIAGHEVNKEKWDLCIERSANGLIYGSRIYLDVMADHWNAVIIGDYESVMPLPWRKKFFVRYYYHVPFVPQTGVFGKLDRSLHRELTRMVFSKIKYGDVLINYDNAEYAKYLSAAPLVNMVLDLSHPYESIQEKYHRDLHKNLKKPARNGYVYEEEGNLKKAVALFKKYYGSKITSLRPSDYERFTGLCLHLSHTGRAFVRKVSDSKGKLLAVALLLKDNKRIYNMMNTVLPDGRSKSANHFLFDSIIREFSGSGLLFDFEGSDIQGIRKFYENFGARTEPYFLFSRFAGVLKIFK